MKQIKLLALFIIIAASLAAQVGVDKRLDKKYPLPEKKASQVILYNQPGYDGEFKILGPGKHLLTDFNDVASSIQVPAGIGVMIYADANEKGGFGAFTDLLEDCADLSVYYLNDKISYINVFNLQERAGYVWVRGRMANNQYVGGHWERKRTNGQLPDNSPPAVVSVINEPPTDIVPPVKTIVDETIPVYRIELRIVTGKRENDDCDKEVFVKLNDNDAAYYLDYGPDDFELGADKRYDIISSSVKTIADIKNILIGVKGDDVWGIQRIELYLNNSATPVFSKAYGLSYRINGSGIYPRTAYFGSAELRNNSSWQTLATNSDLRKPPVPIPFSMIKSMVESMIGNQLHQRSDNKLSWGNTDGANTVWGDHVEVKRKDGNTLSFDLDLEYEAVGVNPEVDVNFDLVFECNSSGAVSIKTMNLNVGCQVLGAVTCKTLLFFVNTAIRMFGYDPYTIPSVDTFSAAFSVQPSGFKCKGVLVNPDGSVFIY